MNGPISVIIGTKGGTGATTICADVATAIARSRNVTLVDADFAARRSVAVLTDMVRALDGNRTTPNMATATKGRLTVLEMAASIDGAFTIAPKDVEAIAVDLSETSDAVIIDAPQPFAAAIRPFVTRASRFVLIVEPTLLGLTNARLVQMELERFGVPATHQVMVLNGRVLRREISRSDIENTLGLKTLAELPIHGDKKYERTIEALAVALSQPSTAGPLVALKPSSSAPIGDRRGTRRRPRRSSAEPECAKQRNAAAPQQPPARRARRAQIGDQR